MAHLTIRAADFSKQIHGFSYCSPSLAFRKESEFLQLCHILSLGPCSRWLNLVYGGSVWVCGVCTHVAVVCAHMCLGCMHMFLWYMHTWVCGVCTHVSLSRHICVCSNMFMEVRERLQMSCCITLCPMRDKVSLWTWSEACGWKVPVVILPLPHTALGVQAYTVPFLALLRVLGSGIRLSRLCNQHLPSEPSLQLHPHCSFLRKKVLLCVPYAELSG